MQVADQSEFITVAELIEQLSGKLSKNSIYDALNRGELPGLRVGRRWFVRRDVLQQAFEMQRADG